jgi:hypothetical protein
MSVSRHPIALRIERRVGDSTMLLATVMALPLLDGIFPALILAGAVDDASGVVETGLLIFGGSATVAVVLAEMDGPPRERMRTIALVGAVLLPAAALEAAIAPTIGSLLDMDVFRRFAGLVILTVAARTASARVGEILPRPAVVIALGLVASVQPATAAVGLVTDPAVVVRGVAAAAVGVGFALTVAALGPRLRANVDLDRFRFGSAVALGMLALTILGVLPTDAPVALGVLGVTAVFAFDPNADADADADERSEGDGRDERDDDGDDDARSSPFPVEEESRAPWL